MFLTSLGCIKIPIPGKARAARFFNSPIVLVKHDTPEKLPTYFPIPKSGMSLRMKVLTVIFANDSLGKGCNILVFLNFNFLTCKTGYKMVNSLMGFLKGRKLATSGLCKNSPISVTLFPTVFNRWNKVKGEIENRRHQYWVSEGVFMMIRLSNGNMAFFGSGMAA